MATVIILKMVFIGLFTGTVIGLTSASGTMVTVPLLVIFLDFSIHESIGTSLMVTALASLGVGYTYYRNKNIDLMAGLWLALGSITGAQIGSLFALSTKAASLTMVSGMFLVISGIIIWRTGFSRQKSMNETPKKQRTKTEKIIMTLSVGLIVGMLAGFLGAGGGLMLLLALLFVLNFPIHEAVGTAILIMALTAFSGSFRYMSHDYVDVSSVMIIGANAVLSGMFSAQFANRINEKMLGRVIGIIFISLGIMMGILKFT